MYQILRKWPLFAGSSVLTGIGAVVIKKYDTIKYRGDEDLNGKTAIVTGSNTGLGKEVARQFAKRGARVVLACRDMESCENAREDIILDTKNPQVICRKLDLSSLSSVREFVKNFNKTETNLNYLINNAGVMLPKQSKTDDAFKSIYLDVNEFGHFFLTMLLLPTMNAMASCRVINVTRASFYEGEMNCDHFNWDRKRYYARNAYSQNILFTQFFAQYLNHRDLKVFAVNPEFLNTEMNHRSSVWYKNFMLYFVKPLINIPSLATKLGVQPIMYCALSPELNDLNGLYYNWNKFENPSDDACDDVFNNLMIFIKKLKDLLFHFTLLFKVILWSAIGELIGYFILLIWMISR